MRRLDDIIVSTINAAIPTDSFHPDGTSACKDLHKQLEEGNSKRENAIKNCINISAEKVKRLRQQRDVDSSNIQVAKNLRAEQTTVSLSFCIEHNYNFFVFQYHKYYFDYYFILYISLFQYFLFVLVTHVAS